MVARGARESTAVHDELPDDTEESVMGTMLHQIAIRTLSEMLEVLREEQGAPWSVVSQVAIRGFRKRSGAAYAPMPDVFLHARAVPHDVTEISLAAYGPPLLVAEVASPTTYLRDLGLKAEAYARGGVGEYVVFDTDGRLLGARGPVWAQRLGGPEAGASRPWRAEGDGRWHSALGFALAPQGTLLRVYDGAGVAVPSQTEEHRLRKQAEYGQREAERRQQEAERRRQEAEYGQQEADRRRQEAERRAADLEAELRRLRGQHG